MNKLIAVVGMAGSGKSLVVDFLEQSGWQKVYFGGAVYSKMQQENIEITPDSQKAFREKIRQEHGMAAVAKLLEPEIKEKVETNDTVLDGLYSWDEYIYLKEKFKNLKLICICCDKKIRHHRIANRKNRPFTNEEIITRDFSEIENLNKAGPIAIADYYVLNNSQKTDCYERITNIINEIDKEGE